MSIQHITTNTVASLAKLIVPRTANPISIQILTTTCATQLPASRLDQFLVATLIIGLSTDAFTFPKRLFILWRSEYKFADTRL